MVEFTITSYTRLGGNINLTAKKEFPITINLRDNYDKDEATELTNFSIEAEIKIESPTIEEAISKAKYPVENFLDQLSFYTNSASAIRKINKAYDISPGVEPRSFRQYFDEPNLLDLPLNIATDNVHDKLQQTLSSIYEENPRLRRALRWYRKGLLATEDINQFLFYWIGLEALSHLIKPQRKIIEKCKNCGYEEERTPVEKDGIRHLVVDKIGMNEEYFKDLWDYRNYLVHGKKAFIALLEESKQKAKEAEAILSFGLKQYLELSDEDPPLERIFRGTGFSIMVSADIFGFDPEKSSVRPGFALTKFTPESSKKEREEKLRYFTGAHLENHTPYNYQNCILYIRDSSKPIGSL